MIAFKWYTPKPVEVLAIQVSPDNVKAIIDWLNDNYREPDHFWYMGSRSCIILDTGYTRPVFAEVGDWIVQPDVDNDAHPVVWSDKKMKATYDKVRG